MSIDTFFNKRNIFQIYISKSLDHFDRIKKIYNLSDYHDKNKQLLIFGLYDNDDLKILKNHKTSLSLMWGGSDANDNIESSRKIINIVKNSKKNIKHYAISINIKERLNSHKITSELLNLNLIDYEIFKPVNTSNKNSIYIYNGYSPNSENLYGNYQEIVKRLPEQKYIFSNSLNLPHNKMPEIYSQCFIGLRLCNIDGNANTVKEFEAMNIDIIHNGDHEHSIKWKTYDDVELTIRYKHIDIFNEKIKKYKNILFLCNDYPSYGGAATNCAKLVKFYSDNGHRTFGIFTHFEKDINYINDDDNIIINNGYKNIKKCFEKCFTYFDGAPDLIIFRSYWNIDFVDNIKCPKYFFIPGLFLDHLNIDYKLIDKNNYKKYINLNVVDLARKCDASYCNSEHTSKILKKLFKIDTQFMYFNYVPFYGLYIKKYDDFKMRKYDIIVCVSNFNRQIKNLDNFIDSVKQSKYSLLLIGKNSNKYLNKNIINIDLIDNKHINSYLLDTKYIYCNSFYESCSNILIEAKFCGCKSITSLDDVC